MSLAGKFSPLLNLGDFCIETAFLRSKLTFRSALICDPCSQRKCIQSCCSHLQMATIDPQSSQMVCQNPPGGGKFVPPRIPEKLNNFTLVRSENRDYVNCEVQNGTLVNTRDYHVSEDGSVVHVGKYLFVLRVPIRKFLFNCINYNSFNTRKYRSCSNRFYPKHCSRLIV